MENIILQEFKRLFSEFDFQHLIKMGAPLDEYDNEALYLYRTISPEDSIKDIQDKIWNIFYKQFCTGESHSIDGINVSSKMDMQYVLHIIGTIETYKEIAEKIKVLLNGNK